MRRTKLVLLGVSLAWLAGWGVVGAARGVSAWALMGYGLVVLAPLAVAGWIGIHHARWRWLSAAVVAAVGFVVAWATFTDLRLLVGALGVGVAILLPPGGRVRGLHGST